MLLFDSKIVGLRVASVQASSQIGTTEGYVINPRNLSIPALYVDSRLSPEPKVLHTSDIRDMNQKGLIIDHDEQLMDVDDLIRLKEIIDIDFQLIGKPVVTEDGHKLGKTVSFIFDVDTWKIIKIHVRQSIIKNMGTSELIIHRAQIVRVSDDSIIVKSAAVKKGGQFSLKKLLLGTPKPALEPDTTNTKT